MAIGKILVLSWECCIVRTEQINALQQRVQVLEEEIEKMIGSRREGKIEGCAPIVERWLYPRLRDRRFLQRRRAQHAIGELLRRLNEAATDPTAWVTPRRQLLEELDRPVLKPLPTQPGVRRRMARTPCRYPLPRRCRGPHLQRSHRCARSEVEVRLTSRTVEIFVKGERIAMHMRSSGNGKHSRRDDTCPPVIAVTSTGPLAALQGCCPH